MSWFSAIALIALFCFSLCTHASVDIPMVNDEPIANQPLNFEEFENVTKLLHSGKLAPHMKCDLKVRTVKEERKFLNGSKLVEVLQIEYYPRGLFVDTKFKLQIPAEIATFGSKVVSTQWSGAGEDIKIEANDSYDHWIRFTHDGKGNIVRFALGSRLATYPCLVRD